MDVNWMRTPIENRYTFRQMNFICPPSPPSNSGKWSFMGIHSLKCKNLGGDYYWERGTAQDIISAIFVPLAHWLGFVACLRMPIVLLLGWDTKPVPYPIGFCSERIVLMPVIDFFLHHVDFCCKRWFLETACVFVHPNTNASLEAKFGVGVHRPRHLRHQETMDLKGATGSLRQASGICTYFVGIFFDMEVQSHMTLHMFDIQNQSQMIYDICYKYTYILYRYCFPNLQILQSRIQRQNSV